MILELDKFEFKKAIHKKTGESLKIAILEIERGLVWCHSKSKHQLDIFDIEDIILNIEVKKIK